MRVPVIKVYDAGTLFLYLVLQEHNARSPYKDGMA